MTPEALADKIAVRIIKSGGMTLDEIEARAKEKDIPLGLLYEAMEIVAKKPKIETSGKKYREKRYRKPSPLDMNWRIPDELYPKLIPGVNDASHPIFDNWCDVDLTLPPEEIAQKKQEWWEAH